MRSGGGKGSGQLVLGQREQRGKVTMLCHLHLVPSTSGHPGRAA